MAEVRRDDADLFQSVGGTKMDVIKARTVAIRVIVRKRRAFHALQLLPRKADSIVPALALEMSCPIRPDEDAGLDRVVANQVLDANGRVARRGADIWDLHNRTFCPLMHLDGRGQPRRPLEHGM